MVKRLYLKKIFWLAITVSVVANLSLGSYVFAKQLGIKAEDVERIKMVLDISKTMTTVTDLILKDKDFLTILNTVIGGGKIATDITYGLVVFSALGEMDLIDLVISQQYKTDARNYFNQVLDERTNLRSYWKGVGTDIPKVLSGYITGSMAALTLNSFEITNKTIAIFTEFNVLEKMKLYDGLWYYFDTRKQGNEPHKIAWEEAKIVMNWALEGTSRFKGAGSSRVNQLEQQFLTLYETWAPYVTPFGISEEYKKQVKEELSGTLIAAVKENAALAKNEPKISLIDKLVQQLEKLKKATADLLVKINPFKAGVALNLPDSSSEELKVANPLSIKIDLKIEPNIEEIQEEPDDISAEAILAEGEPLSIATTTVPEVLASTTEPVLEPEPEPVLKPEPLPTLIVELAPIAGPVFCGRDSGNPSRFRVLINEVTWMGTTNSPNDEWVVVIN